MFGTSKRQQQHIEHLRLRVRELEGLVDHLAARAGVGKAELDRLRSDIEPGITDTVRTLVAQGKTIAAIKEYRAVTGAGLKEAKDAIDAHIARR